MIREAGMEAAADAYVEANVYGTPEQIVEKYAARHDKVGDFFANAAFAFGGMPIDQAEKALKLYGEKVVPELQKMKAPVPAAPDTSWAVPGHIPGTASPSRRRTE